MTTLIDTVSEPGAWARAIGRGCLPEASPMCRACGKPLCDHPDPVFAGIVPLHERVAARAASAQLMITAAGVADIDRYLSEERTRDRDADQLGCGGERVPVHIDRNIRVEARNHAA